MSVVAGVEEEALLQAAEIRWPLNDEYIPHAPTPRQHAFLWLTDVREVFYGGAAGGGKSDALLMAALQYVDDPNYRCLILRKSFAALNLDGAIMDRAHRWLDHTDATWNANDYRWTFPSGARIQFGYLQHSKDRARYQSAEFQCIIFDELTEFDEADYRFMFSRLRRLDNSTTPIRMRSASNPGGIGGKWVKDRFIIPAREHAAAVARDEEVPVPKRMFVPAKLDDNPHVDREEYREALSNLDEDLQKQLLDGDWDAREPGDWMLRDPAYIDSCVMLGAKLWSDHQSGVKRLPDPISLVDIEQGGYASGLVNCVDWGEHTQSYIIWQLPNGGIFVPPSEVVKVGVDPNVTARAMLEAAMKFQFPLIQSNYDAAGIQSMRGYLGVMRKLSKYKRLKSMGIPFNKYKREGIGYLRTLSRRTHEGFESWDASVETWERMAHNYDAYRNMLGEKSPRTEQAKEAMDAATPWRILAIHPANEELIRQLRLWRRKDEESDEAIKVDDHGPDALIAGVAPTARLFREYIEQGLHDAYHEDAVMEYERDPRAEQYEATY